MLLLLTAHTPNYKMHSKKCTLLNTVCVQNACVYAKCTAKHAHSSTLCACKMRSKNCTLRNTACVQSACVRVKCTMHSKTCALLNTACVQNTCVRAKCTAKNAHSSTPRACSTTKCAGNHPSPSLQACFWPRHTRHRSQPCRTQTHHPSVPLC